MVDKMRYNLNKYIYYIEDIDNQIDHSYKNN
jgi:hypothetical protein